MVHQLMHSWIDLVQVTALHFADLRTRYGDPLVVLNLLKSKERKPRELLLRRELATAVASINTLLPHHAHIHYIPWDFAKHARAAGAGLLTAVSGVNRFALDRTGVFTHNTSRLGGVRGQWSGQYAEGNVDAGAAAGVSMDISKGGSSRAAHPDVQAGETTDSSGSGNAASSRSAAARLSVPATTRQHGVLRTNCIDCLDRTNVAQFAHGLHALGRQLHELCVTDGVEVDPGGCGRGGKDWGHSLSNASYRWWVCTRRFRLATSIAGYLLASQGMQWVHLQLNLAWSVAAIWLGVGCALLPSQRRQPRTAL